MLLLRLACIALILSACSSSHPPQKSFLKETDILPGFLLIAAPNALDKPGTLIAVDRKGVRQPLGRLDVALESGMVVPGKDSGSKHNNFGYLLNFLGSNKINASAQSSAVLKRDISYSIKLENSTQERVSLLQIEAQLEKAKAAINGFAQLNDLRKYKFFIITEAVKSQKLDYLFDKSSTDSLAVKSEISKVVDINPNLYWANSNKFSLTYDLKEPLYVFAKYFSLNVRNTDGKAEKVEVGSEIEDPAQIYK